MNFKIEYLNLRDQVFSLGGMVADHNMVGYSNRNKNFIYVKPSLPWKHKLFVLAHECGHLYRLNKGDLMESRQISLEKRAHRRAKQILELIDEELILEYILYWNKVVALTAK